MTNPGSFTLKEIAALVVLMAQARETSNLELEELAGFRLDGPERRRLNDRGLVNSTKVGRSMSHQLTEQGWRFCREQLTSQRPANAGSAGGALFALLDALDQSLERQRLSPAEFFAARATPSQSVASPLPVAPPPLPSPVDTPTGAAAGGDLESRIRATYHRLAKEPGGWVGLADLRPELGPASRAEVDAALTRLAVMPGVHIIPIANLKSLTSRDRDAALRLGGEDNHALAIEGV